VRIGIMLRCMDEQGGIGIYSRYITEELLKLDTRNSYVLFFRGTTHTQRYAGYPNATLCVIPQANNAIWDQISVPCKAKQEKVDLIFNPKFTLPLMGKQMAVMVVHGADWFLPEYKDLYHPLDRLYMRVLMPLYILRSTGIISASDYSTQSFLKYLPSTRTKIKTIHYAPNGIFKPITDPTTLDRVRKKYDLPDPFIFTAIHYDTGRKNFANMLRAFHQAKQAGIPHRFVVCGRDVQQYAEEAPFRDLNMNDSVIFKGWVEQEDLPAFYNLATLYLYPTRLEGFPIPVSEALAAGCPIITSSGGPFAEVAGNAARFVDPENPDDIARAIVEIVGNTTLQNDMRARGLEQAKNFTWANCARQTLAFFESLKRS
jgi:glycosyltransferase involved in cell wall biosynthesis